MRLLNGWLDHPPIEPDEGIAATILAGWAALLILPVNMFGMGPGYATMRNAASEEVWGVAAVLILYFFLLSVAMDHWIGRIVGLTLMSAWWLFVAGMIYDANGFGTGTWTYGVVGLACLVRTFARSAVR